MRHPSTVIKKHFDVMLGEDRYYTGERKNIELGREIERGMNSPFGAALYKALEELERSNYALLMETPPWRIFRQIQIRAELKTAQYIKARLETYVVNAEALLANLQELEEFGD